MMERARGTTDGGSGQGRNIDLQTVEGFGEEWDAFDQTGLSRDELRSIYNAYFAVFPHDQLPPDAEGFDLGCGSGRWAEFSAEWAGLLHCVDPAEKALDVARKRMAGQNNVRFHLADASSIPLADASQDFGYSLGVLHHIPDTEQAMRCCVAKLKPGAPFLVYLYYSFDNKPAWFRLVWKVTDVFRQLICRLPFGLRKAVTTAIAALVYYPVTRVALLLEAMGVDVDNLPLSPYRKNSFYTMRTDALDRFGTRLEQRFSKDQIRQMMQSCGLDDIRFHEGVPYWCACGRRANAP